MWDPTPPLLCSVKVSTQEESQAAYSKQMGKTYGNVNQPRRCQRHCWRAGSEGPGSARRSWGRRADWALPSWSSGILRSFSMALSWSSDRLEKFCMISARNESLGRHLPVQAQPRLAQGPFQGQGIWGPICGHRLIDSCEGPEVVLLSSPLSRPSSMSRVEPQSVSEPALGVQCCCTPHSGSTWPGLCPSGPPAGFSALDS